jgi:hypothetical protein
MSTSAYTQRIRSRVQAKSAKVQYSNNSVGTDIIFNGVVPCKHISTTQLEYDTHKYCILILKNNSFVLQNNSILVGGTPSNPGSNLLTGGNPAGGPSNIASGGNPLIISQNSLLAGGTPSNPGSNLLTGGGPSNNSSNVLSG